MTVVGKILFITGTDTDVGKTMLSLLVMHALAGFCAGLQDARVGVDFAHIVRGLGRIEVQHAKQIAFGDDRGAADSEHERVLQGLVLALGGAQQ